MKEFLGPKAGFMDKMKLLPSLKEVSSWIPKTVKRRGACQEIVMEPPDLTKIRC